MGHCSGAFEGRRWAAHGAPTAGKAAFNPNLQQTMAQYILSSQDLFQTVFKGFLFLAHRESLLSVRPPLALLGCSDLRGSALLCFPATTLRQWGAASPYLCFPKLSCTWGSFFTSGILPGGFLRCENLSQRLIPHQGILWGFTPPRAGGAQGSCTHCL